ncbi:MAG: hypothetical protein JJU10_03960 [Idiomarina sp.]|nr:hypothetical protein [Idiomarina sp.]
MDTNLKRKALTAIIFMVFAGIIIGYELAHWIVLEGLRYNLLPLLAIGLFSYGQFQLRPVLQRLEPT